MTLEELKQAMEDAKAKALAAPNDKALQAAAAQAQKAHDDAVEAAKGSPGGEPNPDPDNVDPDKIDESKLDDKTKAYLAKLRKENAGHRTKNKDLVSKFQASEAQKKVILKTLGLIDDEKPEEKVQKLSDDNQTLAFRAAVLEKALEKGIPKEQLKYFQFLVTDAASGLDEGEELSEEKLEEIARDVKKLAAKGSAATSTVNGGKEGGGNPAPESKDTVTFEKFLRMGPIERSKLYLAKPELYDQFASEAKAKKKLV